MSPGLYRSKGEPGVFVRIERVVNIESTGAVQVIGQDITLGYGNGWRPIPKNWSLLPASWTRVGE